MSVEKLIAFIIPYFGKLPNYFPLFLKSCEANLKYDWLLYTDDHTDYQYPENVKVTYITFQEIKKRIEESFSFQVKLDSPKKLCDFKPTYGFLFQKELRNYPYWGYCDIDLVFGTLENFLNETELRKYKKHYYLGHLSVYENTPEMQRLFIQGNPHKTDPSMKLGYIDVLNSNANMAFDEWSDTVETINETAERCSISINPAFPMLDVRPWRSRFISTVFDPSTHTWVHNKHDNYLVVWEKGKAFSVSKDRRVVTKSEILYAHFQKRKLKFINDDLVSNTFLIYPNRIKAFDALSDSNLRPYFLVARIRKLLLIDETRKRVDSIRALWRHRFRKYILRKNGA